MECWASAVYAKETVVDIQKMERDRILLLILEIVCQMVGAYIPVQFYMCPIRRQMSAFSTFN